MQVLLQLRGDLGRHRVGGFGRFDGCLNDCYFCRRLRIGVGSVLIQVASGLIGRFGIVRLFCRSRKVWLVIPADALAVFGAGKTGVSVSNGSKD